MVAFEMTVVGQADKLGAAGQQRSGAAARRRTRHLGA